MTNQDKPQGDTPLWWSDDLIVAVADEATRHFSYIPYDTLVRLLKDVRDEGEKWRSADRQRYEAEIAALKAQIRGLDAALAIALESDDE